MPCAGVCVSEYGGIYRPRGGRPPTLGCPRCNLCGVFIEWEGNYCPCCRQRLTHRRRKSGRIPEIEVPAQ